MIDAYGLSLGVLALVAIQRLGELVLDKRNTTSLLSQGGVEHGAKHYPLFIILHSAWLASLVAWVLVYQSVPHWGLIAAFCALQAGRVWVLRTLGPYWTTRIISVPGAPLVKKGPYRFIRHPNYCIVVGEIALLPLALGAWPIALIFSVLNGALLTHRIRIENAALSSRHQEGQF